MRTILFRGRDHRGEWHVGYFSADDENRTSIEDACGAYHEVGPSTIGQLVCEAIEDHPEIWEGDIIEIHVDNLEVTQRTVVEWYEPQASFAAQLKDPRNGKRVIVALPIFFIDDDGTLSIKVLGNIHDNPELLNKENEK